MKPHKNILLKSILWGALFIISLQIVAAETKNDSSDTHNLKNDSKNRIKHSPRTAIIMSAVIPGLGQIYNRKYWKVPIIYGSAIGLYLTYDYNYTRYVRLQKSITEYSKEETISDQEIREKADAWIRGGKNPLDYLKPYRDHYRKYKDLNLIMMGGLYVLNIIDAMVDAHLFMFDINDDLTIHISPGIHNGNPVKASGLSLCFIF